jgi:hypothetical protein
MSTVFLLADKTTAVDRDRLTELFPNIYIPAFPTNDFILSLGCYPVIDRPYPEVADNETADIGSVQQDESGYFREWSVRAKTPEELPPPAPTLVSPRNVPRAFVNALGLERGVSVWAKIRKSTNPMCIYWMSEWSTGEQIEITYEPMLAAIRMLTTILDETGVPILENGEPEKVIAALPNG